MLNLKSYGIFAETVAAGSMSAAARRLGLTPSAVSQIIGNLERQTGVTLLHRSTRKLTLTEAGERCYPHCRRLLEARQAATASLEQARDAPGGELRIAAPVILLHGPAQWRPEPGRRRRLRPDLTSDTHFAVQAEPRPPPPHPQAEAQGHELA
jgi:DNA-binding transcriptional LysR family regulator